VSGEMTSALLDVLMAWWRTGSVRQAAMRLGLAEQTIKNQLATARRRSHVTDNLAAMEANWKLLAHRNPDDYRRLRYQFDAAYRERVRNQSREAMRRLRTKRAA
jgi:hypothetical protein